MELNEAHPLAVVKKRTVLTDRQIEVLPLLISGKSYQDIGKRLFRGESRTRQVGYEIFKKFGVNSREQLYELAVKHGLRFYDNSGTRRGFKLNFVEKIFSDATKKDPDQGYALPNQTVSKLAG